METTCSCGAVLTGDDLDAVVEMGVGHFGEAHDQLGLNEIQIRNWVEVDQMIDGPKERLDEIGDIEIRLVSPETRDDILEFFDRRAFADNTGWGMCYCMYHHVGGGPDGEWPRRTWQENRSDLATRIDAGSTKGVVAYVDDVLAGWCNASARDQYPFRSEPPDDGIGYVACFVVAPPYRGHGVQRALLAGAVGMLADAGFETVEGRPIREPKSAGSAFVGTLSLFESQGFEIVSDDPLRVRLAL